MKISKSYVKNHIQCT